MKSYTKSIEELSQDPANARLHDNKNLEAITASLKRFGQQKPIVIDSSGVVRAGNGTLAAAKSLGWETVEVVVTELQGSEATAYAIADNRTAELAEWDIEVLAASLNAIATDDPNLIAAAGYNDQEFENLVNGMSVNDDATEIQDINSSFQLVVTCKDKDAQRALYEELTETGYDCRVLTV